MIAFKPNASSFPVKKRVRTAVLFCQCKGPPPRTMKDACYLVAAVCVLVDPEKCPPTQPLLEMQLSSEPGVPHGGPRTCQRRAEKTPATTSQASPSLSPGTVSQPLAGNESDLGRLLKIQPPRSLPEEKRGLGKGLGILIFDKCPWWPSSPRELWETLPAGPFN